MWPYPNIIAHRGGGALAPENTLAAMKCGLEYGFHAVEFDVMLSKDAIPVVMHDPCLGRTVAGIGQVADFTAQELSVLDAGTWFDAAFAGEPVPTLRQVIHFCRENHIWMNIEIKPSSEDVAAQTGFAVAQLVKEFFAVEIAARMPSVNHAALPLFSSFSFDALMAARALAPEIARGYLVKKIPFDWKSRLDALDAVALHVNHHYLSPVQAAEIKAFNYGLLCYTVNDPARARQILSWGVDALCTDRLDLIGPHFR